MSLLLSVSVSVSVALCLFILSVTASIWNLLIFDIRYRYINIFNIGTGLVICIKIFTVCTTILSQYTLFSCWRDALYLRSFRNLKKKVYAKELYYKKNVNAPLKISRNIFKFTLCLDLWHKKDCRGYNFF